jgi:FAD-dependent halogenase
MSTAPPSTARPDTDRTDTADVVVIGGGPGGSTVANLVAQQGHRVVLLEKEHFPRYQIGESLLPATIHGVCRLLGVTEDLEAAQFMVKRGGSFRWGTSPDPWNFLFALSPRIAGPTSHAYQVDRMTFDHILLRGAARQGVDVREGATVLDAVTEGDAAERSSTTGTSAVRGVVYADDDGVRHTVHARWVVDASGNTGRMHRHVGGERHYSDFFKNIAVFGYFTGGKRLPGPDKGNILCAAFDEGWIWYIPLSDELTSVGAVMHRTRAGHINADREGALREAISRCGIVADYLADAERVTEGTYGEIRVRKDYSYATSTFVGDGMLLVGDAACFVDPVFSTGVHLATYGGLLAARTLNAILSGTVDEQRATAEFEGRYRREYAVFYEFLTSFYDMQVDEGSYFWNARKVTSSGFTDLEAFTTLVGGAHSGELALSDPSSLTSAEAIAERFRTSSAELGAAVEATGAAQTESGEKMGRLFGTTNVTDVMNQMNAIQTRGALGEAAHESPLLPGGLVPTPDGRSWTEPAAAATTDLDTAGAAR